MRTKLTEGSVSKALVIFSLPMICGNMLQQLYNVADTIIVGKTIGSTALAAVGSAYALMVLLTSIILGLCMGSGIVFSQLYGAKKIEDLKTSIANAFVFVLLISIFINVLSFLLLENILIWLNIPVQSLEYARDYLKIIFIGMTFVYLYNFFASILRSVGNTVVPLIFLAISAIVNIVLDIVFIVVFKMDVKGAAWATVIAQILSAVAIIIYFFRKEKVICPNKKNIRYDKKLLGAIINNSTLTAVQQSIMNFGILMVQGLVNSFGFAVSAAFAAVVKIDAFAYMPAQDFGNAFSTFVAQNYGAKKYDRIKKGSISAVKISVGFCLLISFAVFIFAKPLMLLFVKPSEIEVIAIGVQYLRIEGLFYAGIGILFLLYGFYRGVSKASMSIVLTVVSLGSRVILAYTLAMIPQVGVVGIWWSVPIGWALADIFGIVYFVLHKKTILENKLC